MMILGILGGMGPMAGVNFAEILLRLSLAKKDQGHLPFLLSNACQIPDRNAFLMGESNLSPAEALVTEALRLQNAGADRIAIPCNTAHVFLSEIRKAVTVPVLDMIELTVEQVRRRGEPTVGLLATEGTCYRSLYVTALQKSGIVCLLPDRPEQQKINRLIAGIKAGRAVDADSFRSVYRSLRRAGASSVILGCTELSLLPVGRLQTVDALRCLAENVLLTYGIPIRTAAVATANRPLCAVKRKKCIN